MLTIAVYLLFWLLVGHAIADYALQSDFMAKMKNPNFDYRSSCPPGQKPQAFWPFVLTSHALIHGGAVAMITNSVYFGLAETVMHWVIDYCKCTNRIGLYTDQALHVGCKVVWAGALIYAGVQL